MPTNSTSSKRDILLTALEEQRRTYDWLNSGFRNAGTRALTYVAGGLATMTYLYTSDSSSMDLTSRLFIPEATYGKIFYFIGVALVAFGLYSMVRAIMPKKYELPTEQKQLTKLQFRSEEKFLEYMIARYASCFESNVQSYAERSKHIDQGFFPLVFGAIILVVIKIIGG